MKKMTRRFWYLPSLGIGFVLFVNPAALAQSGAVNTQRLQETGTQQPAPPQDPIAQLNLTPEQRQQIRAIRVQSRDERAAINLRVRDTQAALDKALDDNTASETFIEERAREAGEARAAQIRLQALGEFRLRRVLTPEQLRTLKDIRATMAQDRREQRRENRANDGRALPNQRNGIMPLRKPRP